MTAITTSEELADLDTSGGDPSPFVLPRVARPLTVSLTTLLSLAACAMSIVRGDITSAGVMLAQAALPLSGTERERWLGSLVCLFSGAYFAVGAAYSEPVDVLGAFAVVALLRFAALVSEPARLWARPVRSWPTFNSHIPLESALVRALRAPSDAAGRREIARAIRCLGEAPADAVPDDVRARRAFFINVYNVLARHAVLGRRSAAGFNFLEPFRTRYKVAGQMLTLDQIEHSLLRDNAAPPLFPWQRLGHSDLRLRWRVPLDPRIHFALRCGAASCPPVRWYEAERIDEQLELSTSSFLTSESRYDAERLLVTTTALLRFYRADFGGDAGIRALLSRALDDPRIDDPRVAVAFAPYHFHWTEP